MGKDNLVERGTDEGKTFKRITRKQVMWIWNGLNWRKKRQRSFL